jgi:hypothetical protein
MTRDDIAEVSYDAALELTSTEFKCGRITKEVRDLRAERTENARAMMRRIDEILKISDEREREVVNKGGGRSPHAFHRLQQKGPGLEDRIDMVERSPRRRRSREVILPERMITSSPVPSICS